MKKPVIIIGIAVAILAAALALFIQNRINNQVNAPKAITEDIVIDVLPSAFNIPVSYDIEKLEELLNNKLSGKFLEKNIFLQETKKEQITLTLTKQSNIEISSNGKELLCRFPLHVDAKLIESRFGNFLTKQVSDFHTTIIITLSTPVDIDNKWRIVTHFRINKHRWINEPIVKLGPFRKNIKKELDQAIVESGHELTEMLDNEIFKQEILRPAIADVWLDLQDPIMIKKEHPQAWIRFFCNDIKGKIDLNRNNITCYTRVNAQMLMLTDTATAVIPKPLPDLKPLKEAEITPRSDINLYAYTSFDIINEQLNRLLKGKIFTSRGYTVSIKKLKAYASIKGLSVQVITDKDIKGDLVASGQLFYDVPHQKLIVQKFDFSLDTKNNFINTGEEILHDVIRDSIASKLTFDLDHLIGRVPTIINTALAKGKPGKVIHFTVDHFVINKCAIIMDNKNINFKINAGLDADLKIINIKSGKLIRIRDKRNRIIHRDAL
jgi:hypothetical protein